MYGTGHSERVLGQALRGRREGVSIATKFGVSFNEDARAAHEPDPRASAVAPACEAALRRLGVDVIDLYQLHISDCEPEAAREIRGELDRLVGRGLIRAYAWSTDDPERAALFADGGHCAAVQHALHVLADAPEMIDLCERRGLASLNRSPLAMGLLTGKFGSGSSLPSDDVRGHSPAWLTYFTDGRPSPQWLARRAARGPHRERPHARTGGARLDPRAQPEHDPDPGRAHGRTGARERRSARARAPHRGADGTGRPAARRQLTRRRSVCAPPPADRTVTV